MSGHTPGPWRDHGDSYEFNLGERVIASESQAGYAVAVTIPCGTPDEAPDRNIANARLIAAAPELLEALEASVMDLEYAVALAGSVNQMRANAISIRLCTVRAAIAAATGELS